MKAVSCVFVLLFVFCMYSLVPSADCQALIQVLRRWGVSPFKEVNFEKDSNGIGVYVVTVAFWYDAGKDLLSVKKQAETDKLHFKKFHVYPSGITTDLEEKGDAVPLTVRVMSHTTGSQQPIRIIAPGVQFDKSDDDIVVDGIPETGGKLHGAQDGKVHQIAPEDIYEIILTFESGGVSGNGTPMYLFRGFLLKMTFSGFFVVGMYYFVRAIREERRRRREELGRSSSDSSSGTESSDSDKKKKKPTRRVPIYRQPGNELKLEAEKKITTDNDDIVLVQLQTAADDVTIPSSDCFSLGSALSVLLVAGLFL